MAFSWRRGRRRGEVEAAGRRPAAARRCGAALDFADHDDVIAFDVAAAVVAFEPAAQPPSSIGVPPGARATVRPLKRSGVLPVAKRRASDLVSAQHIDDVAIAALEGFRDDEPPDRLHSTSGGFSDTELKELTVSPMARHRRRRR